jgi:hypothetical protein
MCLLTHCSLRFRPDGVDAGAPRRCHDLGQAAAMLIAAPLSIFRNNRRLPSGCELPQPRVIFHNIDR